MDTSPDSKWFYAENDVQKGPIRFSQLQEKIEAGFDQSNLVWTESMTDWIPASQVPALSDLSVSKNPYAAPSSEDVLARPDDGSDMPPATPIPLSIGFCVNQAWKHTTANFGKIILFLIVYYALGFAVQIGISLVTGAGMTMDSNSDVMAATFSPLMFIGLIFQMIVSIFLMSGAIQFGLKILKNDESAGVGDLFSQGGKLLKICIAWFIFYIMIFIGFMLLIFPGIYLMLRFGAFHVAMVEKDLGIMESFKYSSDLTRDNKLNLCGLWFVSLFIILAGTLAILIGLLWAAPTAMLSYLVAYRYLHKGEQGIVTR